jgi:hypothetical protein
VTPYLREVLPRGFGAFLVKAVHVPAADLLVRHEAGMVEQAQVSRDRRAADWKLVGDFLDGPRFAHQQLDDGAPVRVAEGVKRVIVPALMLGRRSLHLEYGNG